ncbi:MAG TPA: P1 family peptidase [Thermohalobaculum sp.]|nr:P1 family peptidase [Thermohalobaculum sp.]
MGKPRARELGLAFPGLTGPWNAITDVPGLSVGMTTLNTGDGPLVQGQGPVRTGVTAILPREEEGRPSPVWAGYAALNGNGEMTGTHWIDDAGYFLGPVCITNTHSVGMVHHAVTGWMIRRYGAAFADGHLWAMPVVAETYDGVLNDINGRHVREEHVLAALDGAASGPVAEGNVGGGTGMIAYEFKAGTGTASRRVTVGGAEYMVGVLVQANMGIRPWLKLLGVPVGRYLTADRLKEDESGSIIAVVATDAPLGALSLRHVARRAGLGIGRTGTPGGNSSGDIFLAFSTANRREMMEFEAPLGHFDILNGEYMNPVYLGAVEAVEEAIINAMVAAEDMTTLKPAGRVCRAIDTAALVEVMGRHGRLRGAHP